ncbi:MAG: bifunctional [glutamate--ammonia ligase]-adenylyl-L-tyrosine phosphorylase/[glutamate--ammonia-ligase] adenylyltransferase, partial [Myxococcota bacterium]
MDRFEGERFHHEVRRYARRAMLWLAFRALLPEGRGGGDLRAVAAEISHLADTTIGAALAVAQREATTRYGPLVHADDRPGRLVILGMGKLGGGELNPGSDVDLICVYDSDTALARAPDGTETEAHLFWTRVVRRMTELLADV